MTEGVEEKKPFTTEEINKISRIIEAAKLVVIVTDNGRKVALGQDIQGLIVNALKLAAFAHEKMEIDDAKQQLQG